ncbi:hypothetical protein IGI49_000485 [Enterococcus sp. AZ071]|uniref:hypothetical protein n=2 Tax=unclassified Enterococcus TaxID=2608891 RepID=UPI003D2C802E
MEVTQLSMHLVETVDSPVLMTGELVLDHQLVIKEVALCRSKYDRYYLQFPTMNNLRVVHPIQQNFYQRLLETVMADYHRKVALTGRKARDQTL